MPQMRLDDFIMHYKRVGEGPVIVLLMGFGGNMNWWPDHVVEELSKDNQIILIDNRGTGKSERGYKPYSMKTLADDVDQLLSSLSVEKASVFGVSMGGMIAQELVLRHPKRFEKLLLACSFGGVDPLKLVSKDHLHLCARYLKCQRTRSSSLFSNLIFTKNFRQEMSREEWEKIVSAMNEHPLSRTMVREQLSAIARWRSWSRLPEISIPTLVMTGDKDLLVHPNYSRRLANRIPNARLKLIPNQGHGFLYELGTEIMKPIRRFFSEGVADETEDLKQELKNYDYEMSNFSKLRQPV